MNEGEDAESASPPPGGKEDEGSITKKKKMRKKKSDLASSMDSSKKGSGAKLRRKGTINSNDDGGSSEGRKPPSSKPQARRKSTDSRNSNSDINTPPPSSTASLGSQLSKSSTAGRRSSKSGGAGDDISAASGGSRNSGGSKKSLKKRTKSPNRSPNLIPPSGRKDAKGAPDMPSEGTASAGIWDVPSFGGNDTASAKDSAFDGGAAGGGFSDFSSNDAFTDNSFFPSATSSFGQNDFANSNKSTTATIPENEAFSSDPASFFDVNSKGTSFGPESDDAAFGSTPLFGSDRRESLDKTPLKDPPRRKIAKMSMAKKTIFAQNFACQPTKNPLNGNIIFCTSKNGEMYIQEVDPKRGFVQVLCSPILTSELHKKVTTKYNRSAYGVDNVLKLCVGVHRSHGQPRLRVVAVIDLLVLDSKHILRAMAVWQWGHGTTHPVSLQFLLSPPSGTDYAYNPESIVAADNIVFVSGASAKGPCIFMCKPSVRESWSANFLAPDGKITAMAVTSTFERTHPYMAVGMADGSLSVWTYAAALKQTSSKKNEPFRRLLYPLCRLDALWVLNNLQATNFAEDSKKQKAEERANAGMCTSIEWLPPQSSLSSLLMLAAGFQGGMAVFHVALPHIADDKTGKYKQVPPPTQSTQLSSTPPIRPFAAVRLPSQLPDVFVSWTDFGPHNNPCLALLLHGKSSDDEAGRVVLGSLNMTEYRKGSKAKESLLSFRVLTSTAWRSKSKAFPLGLLSCSGLSAVVCHVDQGISALYPTLSGALDDPSVRSLRYPVFSNPPGVDSSGGVFLTDSTSDKEGILHVFSSSQCDLSKNDMHPEMLTWSRPARRHWLCRTLCGDRKETRPKEDVKEVSQFGDDEDIAIGGGTSDVICELDGGKALSGMTPFRIVKCRGTSIVAVVFRPSLGNLSQGASGLSMDCVLIALLDSEKKKKSGIEIVEGRDIAFLPFNAGSCRALILSKDGGSVSVLQKSSTGWDRGSSCRPILGVECDENYIEALRLFVVSGDSKYGIAVVGTKHSDERSCILCGPMASMDQFAGDDWTKGLPEMSPSQPCLWLKGSEAVLSIISLPVSRPSLETPQKLAVSTPSRVFIFDSNLEVQAELRTHVASGALAPLGASSVSFCSMDHKIRYLSCLDKKLSSGILATLPTPRFGYGTCLLLAVRPDRFLHLGLHSGVTLAEHNDDPDSFMLPTAVTRPAMLLEPLVANAICEGAKDGKSTVLLRGVIEKFGRKMASITHGENEGIGNRGTGITPRVYELLSRYNLDQAASWLLTGGVQFSRSANSKILPPWMPISVKREAAINSDAFLHLVANGDQYLSEYVQSPDHNMNSQLPRPGNATPYLCREYGQDALGRGNGEDILKMLDFTGTESDESMLLQLSLLLEVKAGDATELLKSISGYGEQSLSSSSGLPTATTSLAALATHMKVKSPSHQMNASETRKWIQPLAPSLQRGTRFPRVRPKLLGERALRAAVGPAAHKQRGANIDPQFVSPCNESRHIWNEGPNKEKESLLLLDKIEDWLGRRRPILVGKEGVAAAEERGEGALANILDMDKDESTPGREESDDEASEKKGWETGVGEGRLDEENLSGYFRFWEGEDEESPWRTEGLSDLSRFQNSNKAIIVGNGEGLSLQPTTSSVDEGDPGKVKSLYDLVFEEAGDQEPSGLAIAATRGTSIDVGMLHLRDRIPRQRCTLEFWYYLPPASAISGEITLARRTFGEDADDFSKICVSSDKRAMLWEINLLKSGELEFRTCGGDTFRSSQNKSDDDDTEESERKDLAKFERWNHVCLVFSSRDVKSLSGCAVFMFMMGASVASMDTSMLPPGLEEKELNTRVDDLMEKSHLVFGLNNCVNFRLTELRVWACERSEDDIKMMMREHLDAATTKKKFRVRIGKNKKGGGAGGLLSPPVPGGLAPPKGLTPPKSGGLAPPKGTTKALLGAPKGSGFLSPPKSGFLAPPKDHKEPDAGDQIDFAGFSTPSPAAISGNDFGDPSSAGFEASFGAFGTPDAQTSESDNAFSGQSPMEFTPQGNSDDAAAWGDLAVAQDENDTKKQSLWDTATPLSQQVRSSAAAALIRGPPATRHFGGNRGGLPDLRGTDRYGVGGIAICGSEKTIVWRDEEDPPALTYPIGASGAIVSDQLDDEEGSEFLCCFLAKDKRMVVFELNSRTVVVELQMTTKLNFWRFLPPEAGESSLCFMLITPVGGFHWMPLDDSPRPRQVWKRGSDLQGKKIVSYEEGGTNGLAGPEMISKIGLICATDSNGTGTLEAWMVPICGDSGAVLASGDVQGAAFCLPEGVEGIAFLPLLVLVVKDGDDLKLNISTILEPEKGSVAVGEVILTEVLPASEHRGSDFDPPTLAMGVFPDVMVCTLGNIIVVILRATGTMIAYEFKANSVHLIVTLSVDHYVIDAVMRYSAIEGGAEVLMLLSDSKNHKDGRIVSHNFRSSA